MNTVLFDLDGTLLPMNIETFTEAYCGALARKLAPHGLDPKKMIAALWKGTDAMIQNDGSQTNEDCFWDVFQSELQIKKEDYEEIMDDFYRNDFKALEAFTEKTENATKCIKILKEKGYRLVVATNPLFPRLATMHRIHFAGLDENDFECYTTFEEYHYAKPNPKYYLELMERIEVKPEDCIMIGNDVQEDGSAIKAGAACFIITDNLIQRKEEELVIDHGTFAEFVEIIKSWPSV